MGLMSIEDEQHVKSRNPEKFTILDKESLSRYTTDTGKILAKEVYRFDTDATKKDF